MSVLYMVPYYPGTDHVNQHWFVRTVQNNVLLRRLVGCDTNVTTVYWMNMCTAVLHLVSGITVAVLAVSLERSDDVNSFEYTTGPYIPSACVQAVDSSGFPIFSAKTEHIIEKRTYLTVLISLLFLFPAYFQIITGLNRTAFQDRVITGEVNLYRYIEYSLSVSVMMVTISLTLMIYDVYTHLLIFTCTCLCMLLGLIADYVRLLINRLTSVRSNIDGEDIQDLYRSDIVQCICDLELIKWFLHRVGWVALIVLYIGIFVVSYWRNVLNSASCVGDSDSLDPTPRTPWSVHVVIVSQFIYLVLVGGVQLAQFRTWNQTAEHITNTGIRTEYQFIWLSFVSKSILGWVTAVTLIFI
jgi:hypothetical protein